MMTSVLNDQAKKAGKSVAVASNKPAILSKPKLAAGKGKSAVANLREFGELRLDYLSACKHDLKSAPASCPLCKLASYETAAFFAAEAEQRKRNREESCKNRALLRIDLLSHWDRCQSLHYVEFEGNKCSQVYLSKSLLETLCGNEALVEKYAQGPINFEYLERTLQRRNRMYEAGHLAALFIQARVRRFLVRRRVRQLLLHRFEYVAATKYKAEFYVDNTKRRKWDRYPVLIQDERPGTPRTIQRRLNFEGAIFAKRLELFRSSLAKQTEVGSGQSFEGEEALVQFYKQLVVARDVAAIAMARLRKIVTDESGSAPQDFAVWILPTSPAASTRQAGLAFVLQNRLLGASAMASMSEGQRPAVPKSASRSPTATASTASTGSGGVPVNAVNRALQLLETASYEALVCRSAEEIVQKLLQADLLPLYASVLNISQDEYGIWNGSMDYLRAAAPPSTVMVTPAHSLDTSSAPAVLNTSNSVREEDPTGPGGREEGPEDKSVHGLDPSHASWEVLPFGLQLRVHTPRQPAGYFRLFFYEEEFVGVSAASPWVFYPEVHKNRDAVLNALRKFALATSTRAFVHDYYKLALAKKAQGSGKEAGPSGGKTAGDARRVTLASGRGGIPRTQPPAMAPVAKDPGVLFSPPEQAVLPAHRVEDKDVRIPAPLTQLSDAQVVALRDKYRFVSKLAVFMERYKRAQANESRRAVRGRTSQPPASRPTPQTSTRSSFLAGGAGPSASTPSSSPSVASTETAPNLQAIRRNRQEGLLVHLHVLLDSMQTQGQLRGSAIYDLLCPPLSETALSLSPAAARHAYLSNLLAHLVAVQTNIKQRIQQPRELVERKQTAQLLVLDVYVHLPQPKLPSSPGTPAVSSTQSTKTKPASSLEEMSTGSAGSGDTTVVPGLVKTRPAPGPAPFTVEVHQVVGVFNCASERPSPNLDTGLFPYDHFHRMHKEHCEAARQGAVSAGKSAPGAGMIPPDADRPGAGPAASTAPPSTSGKERGWSSIHPQSGVCVGRASLPSGKEFQCLLLGAAPTIDYLEQVLPKKVQLWLGWSKQEEKERR